MNEQQPRQITLRLSRSQLALAVYSPFSNEEPEFEVFDADPKVSVATSLRAAIEHSAIANGEYVRAEILVDSPYTLMPISLFNEESVASVFSINFPNFKNAEIHFDVLPHLGAVLIYGIDELAAEALRSRYKLTHTTCNAAPLIQHFHQRSSQTSCRKLFAYQHGEWLDICVFSGTKLLLANRYHTTQTDDSAYICLLAAKKLDFKLQEDELYVVGDDRQASDSLRNRLLDFAPNSYPVNPAGEFNRHKLTRIGQMPYDLLLLLLRQY